ncbi:MAG: outer membrane beta-barrel protein, partial [Nitrospirae bacterium]|nr:outer membrane beta-barrel protein [Nitrospirota bacterium]
MSARSRIGIGIGMCALVSLLGSNAVFAQEAQLRAPLESKDADSVWSKLGLKISGATDVTYTQNFNNPSNNINNLRIFDTQANSFVPQVAQIVIEKPATAGSAYDRVG